MKEYVSPIRVCEKKRGKQSEHDASPEVGVKRIGQARGNHLGTRTAPPMHTDIVLFVIEDAEKVAMPDHFAASASPFRAG
jgi:hypothetical protein